jgi:hypothetical protein
VLMKSAEAGRTVTPANSMTPAILARSADLMSRPTRQHSQRLNDRIPSPQFQAPHCLRP